MARYRQVQREDGSTTMRCGVPTASHLLARFDALIATQGYTNHSEAIRDLVRELANRLLSLKGIEHGRRLMTGTAEGGE